ncbi:metallophosphoesterase [bacterium SCSIO 12741]|nr:metallophosphoesterase [bacterium SCSIO 12741]
MNARLLIPLLIILLYVLSDVWLYKRLKKWYGERPSWRWIGKTYWASVIIIVLGLGLIFYRMVAPPIFPSIWTNWFIGFSFSVLVCKMLLGIWMMLDGFIHLPFWVRQKVTGKAPSERYSNSRRKFVQTSGIVMAGLPFLSMVKGITFGKYDYRVHRVPLTFPNLPKAFDGFTIAQLSDIHTGSFDSKSSVLKGIEMVNDLKADLVVFTGDLVNSRSDEVLPFMDIFSKLSSPNGVMSTKGNHDYGIYYQWENQEAHTQDQLNLAKYHKELGFDLLNNENRILEKDGEKMAIVGVENWGLPPFPQVGDLDKALQGTEEVPFTVLLSHDPSHWDEKVLSHSRNIDLTLSGHTHGMQFGVDLTWLKWSPVKYKYPRWAGLYREADQYLYVNRGFGFIGFPGRVGILPEITLFELKRG